MSHRATPRTPAPSVIDTGDSPFCQRHRHNMSSSGAGLLHVPSPSRLNTSAARASANMSIESIRSLHTEGWVNNEHDPWFNVAPVVKRGIGDLELRLTAIERGVSTAAESTARIESTGYMNESQVRRLVAGAIVDWATGHEQHVAARVDAVAKAARDDVVSLRTDLAQCIGKLENDVAKAHAAMDEQMSVFADRFATGLKELSGSVSRQNDVLGALDQRVAEQRTTLQTLDRSVTHSREQMSQSLEARETESATRLRRTQAELDTFREDHQRRVTQAIEELNAHRRQHAEELVKLRQSIADTQQRLEEAQRKAEEHFTRTIDKHRHHIKETMKTVKEVQTQVVAYGAAASTLAAAAAPPATPPRAAQMAADPHDFDATPHVIGFGTPTPFRRGGGLMIDDAVAATVDDALSRVALRLGGGTTAASVAAVGGGVGTQRLATEIEHSVRAAVAAAERIREQQPQQPQPLRTRAGGDENAPSATWASRNLDELARKVEALSARVDGAQLEQDKRVLASVIGEVTATRESLEAHVRKAELSTGSLRDALQHAAETHQRKLAGAEESFEAQCKALRRTVDDIRDAADQTERRRVAGERAIAEVSGRVEAMSAQMGTSAQAATRQVVQQAVEKQAAELKAEIFAELRSAQQQRQDLEARSAAAAEARLAAALTSTEESVKALRAKVDDIVSESRRVTSETALSLTTFDRKIAGCVTKDAGDRSIAELAGRVETSHDQLAKDLQRRVQAVAERCEAAERKVAAPRALEEELRVVTNELQRHVERQAERLADVRESHAALRSELARAVEQAASAQQASDEMGRAIKSEVAQAATPAQVRAALDGRLLEALELTRSIVAHQHHQQRRYHDQRHQPHHQESPLQPALDVPMVPVAASSPELYAAASHLAACFTGIGEQAAASAVAVAAHQGARRSVSPSSIAAGRSSGAATPSGGHNPPRGQPSSTDSDGDANNNSPPSRPRSATPPLPRGRRGDGHVDTAALEETLFGRLLEQLTTTLSAALRADMATQVASAVHDELQRAVQLHLPSQTAAVDARVAATVQSATEPLATRLSAVETAASGSANRLDAFETALATVTRRVETHAHASPAPSPAKSAATAASDRTGSASSTTGVVTEQQQQQQQQQQRIASRLATLEGLVLPIFGARTAGAAAAAGDEGTAADQALANWPPSLVSAMRSLCVEAAKEQIALDRTRSVSEPHSPLISAAQFQWSDAFSTKVREECTRAVSELRSDLMGEMNALTDKIAAQLATAAQLQAEDADAMQSDIERVIDQMRLAILQQLDLKPSRSDLEHYRADVDHAVALVEGRVNRAVEDLRDTTLRRFRAMDPSGAAVYSAAVTATSSPTTSQRATR
jgi:hypothetical protein